MQVGSMIFFPMISILSETIGLPWTCLVCAALMVVSVLLVFCVKVPQDDATTTKPADINEENVFLAPLALMSVGFANVKEQPKRKRNLITPMFVAVCILNAIMRSYSMTAETLFMVSRSKTFKTFRMYLSFFPGR